MQSGRLDTPDNTEKQLQQQQQHHQQEEKDEQDLVLFTVGDKSNPYNFPGWKKWCVQP